MTTQEAYELMRTYLTRPGARQASHPTVTPGCSYEIELDGDLHRCAVGCLLSPAAISELRDEEKLTAAYWGLRETHEEEHGLAVQELIDVEGNFLYDAQSVHDNPDNWESGRFYVLALDVLAERYGLEVVEDTPVEEHVPELVAS